LCCSYIRAAASALVELLQEQYGAEVQQASRIAIKALAASAEVRQHIDQTRASQPPEVRKLLEQVLPSSVFSWLAQKLWLM
jgi:hypothetical protein